RHDLAHLNRTELRVRTARGDLGSRLDARRLDHEVPRDDLLRLRERPIQDPLLPAAGPDSLRLSHRMQRRAAFQRAVTHQPHRVLADALDGLLPLLLRRDQLRVLIQHEHELHRPPLLSAAFDPLTPTTPPQSPDRHRYGAGAQTATPSATSTSW